MSASEMQWPHGAPNSPSDFGSGMIELHVGPYQKVHFVHQAILTKIPFFSEMLRQGNWMTNQPNSMPSINLPEDDTDIFDKILAYAYQGKVALTSFTALLRSSSNDDSAKEIKVRRDEEMFELVHVYIMASRFSMEQYANDIVDRFQSYLKFQGVDPNSFVFLIENGPPQCRLRELLVAEIAWEARAHGYETYKHKKPDLFNAFVEAELGNALDFARWACDVKTEPAWENQTCKWHTHTQTAQCVWPVVDADTLS